MLNRVNEASLVRILAAIAQPPNLRDRPLDDDPKGDFDQWFEGGTVRFLTGSTEYQFSDGTVAVWSKK